MISFNMELKNTYQQKFQEKNIITEGHCDQCIENKYCLKFLSQCNARISDFNFVNYLIYIFYPPVYFSGPTILFNSFIYQINNIKSSQHQKFLSKEKIIYILRYLFVFICFEIFNSLVYVNAYLTNYYNKYIWQEFDYYTYSVFCFFLLIFIWFKFTIIWRTSRLWAWMDGIYTEENMNRCMYNNYSFEGFWRAWHRSFNIWLIRYIFIPLGGSKFKVINIWVVFSFVALWHDLQLNLLIWGWFICLFLMPEILVKNYFNKEKVNINSFHNIFLE
jgi:D-alanyl-lipoteichoic acid acyltransferase DltB (MBOAT superfamily)